MIRKPLSAITIADIEALAANAVSEGRTLEYKAQLPGPSDADKREFLADVTSLANTDGGDLIYGVTENGGQASSVPGVTLTLSLEDELLRLESLLATCIEPRLIGAKPATFKLPNGNTTVLWRIPASFAAPHRANHKDVRRFYHRNSSGKAEMDVHELRAAFTSSEGFIPRLADLHKEAVRLVVEDDLPFNLLAGARAILSIIPLTVLSEMRELLLDHKEVVWPVTQQQGTSWLQALEGVYVYGVSNAEDTASFALTRRTGQIDVVWQAGRQVEADERFIWPIKIEETINAVITGASVTFASLGIDGPFAVGLTIIELMGFRLWLGNYSTSRKAWRSRLAVPLIVIDDLQPEALLPLARSFWLGMGEIRPDKPLGKTGA